MGIRVLCEATSGKSHFVFGDDIALYHRDGRRSSNHRDQAFGDWMHKTMAVGRDGTRRTMDEQIRLFGGPAKDFGTQSNRKGGLEELTTSPDGPPPVAALMRSGHSIGGVVEKYILQMHGGDEFCSRICAGLDMQAKRFAVFPPHFNRDFLDRVDFSDFVYNYNSYDPCFQTCVPFLVAAVAYQWSTGWIAANLPGNHPLFSSPCVRRRHMEELASHVDVSILHCGDCGMRATGIPSVVRIAMDLEALTLRQSEMARELRNVMGNDDGQSLSKTVVGQIEQHLAIMSERFVDALVQNSSKLEGSLTSSTTKMEQRLAIAVERLGVVRVNAVDKINGVHPSILGTVDMDRVEIDRVDMVRAEINRVDDASRATESINTTASIRPLVAEVVDAPVEYDYAGDDVAENNILLEQYNVHTWARHGEIGRLHPIAEAYQFRAKLSVSEVFEMWFTGDLTKGTPPLKCLRSWDVAIGHESYYHKAKSVCNTIVWHARRNSAIPQRTRLRDLSFAQRTRILTVGVDAILMAHNDYMHAKAKAEGNKFVPFAPKRSTNMSFVTMHKYLHNAAWKDRRDNKK
jgi:hypothetical protein